MNSVVLLYVYVGWRLPVGFYLTVLQPKVCK